MSELFKPLYQDTDSVVDDKMLTVILARRNEKAMLNAIYGTQMSKYWQPTILKENKNMNREYIVIHKGINAQAGIIFKDSVEVILPYDDDIYKTEIRVRSSCVLVTDRYEDVVKQMFK